MISFTAVFAALHCGGLCYVTLGYVTLRGWVMHATCTLDLERCMPDA